MNDETTPKRRGVEVLASDSYVISDEEADDIRYEGIDTTQQAQMDSALEHIRATLVANFKTEADATTKGLISNTEIKDVLWDSYFNVDESLDWATSPSSLPVDLSDRL